MPIFVEHWGGGVIRNFTPNLPYFQHWGMNLDYDFFQVSKLNEDQKKKKVFTKNGTLFSPNSSGHLRSDAHQSQIIGEDADVDHTQTIGWGGNSQIIGGIYLPIPPPGFGTPEALSS